MRASSTTPVPSSSVNRQSRTVDEDKGMVRTYLAPYLPREPNPPPSYESILCISPSPSTLPPLTAQLSFADIGILTVIQNISLPKSISSKYVNCWICSFRSFGVGTVGISTLTYLSAPLSAFTLRSLHLILASMRIVKAGKL